MISLVVARSENHAIGVANRLPWHIPEDLKRFKQITSGHPMIMGRKTFESIGKALPNRTNIVVTRNLSFTAPGVLRAGSLDEALELAARSPGAEEIFVIGGSEIFTLAIPRADRIYLTEVHRVVEGDAFFEYPEREFREVSSEKLSNDATLHVLERR